MSDTSPLTAFIDNLASELSNKDAASIRAALMKQLCRDCPYPMFVDPAKPFPTVAELVASGGSDNPFPLFWKPTGGSDNPFPLGKMMFAMIVFDDRSEHASLLTDDDKSRLATVVQQLHQSELPVVAMHSGFDSGNA